MTFLKLKTKTKTPALLGKEEGRGGLHIPEALSAWDRARQSNQQPRCKPSASNQAKHLPVNNQPEDFSYKVNGW